MSDTSMRIVYSSGISNLVEHNSSFDSGILRVAYTGKNRNGSFISKDAFERSLPTIYNCPIVCNYDREDDSIGSHDVDIVTKDDGSMRLINVTQPVGVIPESAKHWWELVDDESGEHEYLCVDALLWKRQEAYEKIKTDGVTDESMEITVTDGSVVDGVFVIERFEFTAFCLLGSAEPCFESASLELFSHKEFQDELSEMMRDFKASCSMVSTTDVDEHNDRTLAKGGNVTLNTDLQKTDFNDDEQTMEQVVETEEPVTEQENVTVDSGANDEMAKDATESAFELAEQFKTELLNSLESVDMETPFGPMCRYCYIDYDPSVSEVYAYDFEDWKLYGFTYSKDGDSVVVDFESKSRKKFAIVDFDEGEQSIGFANTFKLMSERYTQAVSEWEGKYAEVEGKVTVMENELTELRQYKDNVESAKADAQIEELFERFSDLDGIEAFEELRNDHSQISLEDLEEKCYAIRGRNGTKAKFEAAPKAPKLKVGFTEDNEPYNGVFNEYGIKKKS